MNVMFVFYMFQTSKCSSSGRLVHAFFYVLLTMYLSIILVINQLNAQNLVL